MVVFTSYGTHTILSGSLKLAEVNGDNLRGYGSRLV